MHHETFPYVNSGIALACTNVQLALYAREMRRVDNPKNRFERTQLEWVEEPPPHAGLEVHEERRGTESILSENDRPAPVTSTGASAPARTSSARSS